MLLLTLSLLSVFAVSSVKAQHYTSDSRNYFDYGEQFYSRIVQRADGRAIDVRMNMASAMFSFLRAEKLQPHPHTGFYAIRDVNIELTERGNSQAIASKNIVDTIFVRSFEETTMKNEWHALDHVLPLPELDSSKHYLLRVEIRDGILSKLAVRPLVTELRVRPFHPNAGATDSLALGLSDVTLLDRAGLNAATFAKGNTYPFSRDIAGSFEVAYPASLTMDVPQNLHARVTLTELSRISDPDDTAPREVGQVKLDASVLHLDSSWHLISADSMLQYSLTRADTSSMISGARMSVFQFEMPGRALEQGRYRITVDVTCGALHRSLTNDFALVWPDMPVSLEDPRDAINPLVHITTDGDFKDLQKGSRPELIRKLYAFWKRQDPTSGTAFNERMAAFYQRVDYAYFNYANQHSLDGTSTDRGKIYILYGPPTKIERELLPGESPVETWTYTNNVHRQFKFTDVGNRGEYRLVDVKNI